MRNQGFYNRPPDDSRRGVHPDIDPQSGELRPEALTWADPAERDFNARFANDQTWAADFMEKVARRQAQLPPYVQQEVAGKTFGEGRGTYAGLREYQQTLDKLNAEEDQFQYGNGTTVVRDHELEAMPLERYEQLFDDRGRPRPGVVVEYSARAVRLDDGIDPHSAGELRQSR